MTTRSTKKTEEWNQKRNQVLETAARLFAQQGSNTVSMRDIGAACNLHMSTLYHYFPSRAALYEEVCRWACEYASAVCLRPLLAAGTPQQRLHNFVQTIAHLFIENGPAAGILDRELVYNNTPLENLNFPSISKEPVIALEALLKEMSPPLLKSIQAKRLGEISGISSMASSVTSLPTSG